MTTSQDTFKNIVTNIFNDVTDQIPAELKSATDMSLDGPWWDYDSIECDVSELNMVRNVLLTNRTPECDLAAKQLPPTTLYTGDEARVMLKNLDYKKRLLVGRRLFASTLVALRAYHKHMKGLSKDIKTTVSDRNKKHYPKTMAAAATFDHIRQKPEVLQIAKRIIAAYAEESAAAAAATTQN